jgi:protein gp37
VNAWLGTTVESDEQRARADDLIEAGGALASVLFLSCEPLLGPLDLKANQRYQVENGGYRPLIDDIQWVIAGGESGGYARPSNPKWFRDLRDQCVSAGVAFHFKQWGEWAPTANVGFGDSPRAKTHTFRTGEMVETHGGPVPFGIEMRSIGKKAAGRLLDGREWDEYPRTKAVAAV